MGYLVFQNKTAVKAPGYKKTKRKRINKQIGKKVMVTSRIRYSKMGVCTEMGCSEENPCCNRCGLSYANFKKIKLLSNDDTIGCSGNECNWRNNCAYSRNDRVTIYGKVKEKNVIEVHEHCKV